MIKEVIRQTKDKIGIVPASKFSQYVYENELKIVRMLLCDCSKWFIELLLNSSKEDMARILSKELKEDKQTIYSN